MQINYCKNPSCNNFGVPATQKRTDPNYNVVAAGKNFPVLKCKSCGEMPPLKSNRGICEEINRISSYITSNNASIPYCANPACDNHEKDINASPSSYKKAGKTKSGYQRYQCKSCLKTFSENKPTKYQRKPHINKTIFKLLVNKMPFRRICEVVDISEGSLYPKIDFIHQQCLKFVADRESKLLSGSAHLPELQLSTDRQDYVVNWTNRKDKRNLQLNAVATTDNRSGYVFAM